ncbi:MAG: RIP metalloprotease RseP [Spirochaetes bacterium]|nr:RIP metalloprotease RseP [Spirochaetota bacterium]MBN2772264.1 RIP metalloprotease RseP [Spirochaetota bacterium]
MNPDFFVYILWAGLLLGCSIFVHELGHLLGGKMVGIKARVFSLGYGKGFIKKKWGDTTYQITLIPFGGYCAFYGDVPGAALEGKNFEFFTASPWRRIVTVVMGPLFNLFFGIILFFALNLAGYEVETNRIMIPESSSMELPAQKAGLKSGDTVVAIDDKEILSFMEIQSAVVFSDGKPLDFTVVRDGKKLDFKVTPVQYSNGGYYSIGIMPYGTDVLITGLEPSDVAQKAGLKVYDRVKAINGESLKGSSHFSEILQNNGEVQLVLQIERSGENLEIEITPRFREQLVLTEFHSTLFPDESFDINVSDLDTIKTAIKKGTVSVNGKNVADFDDFLSVIESLEGGKAVIDTKGGSYEAVVKYRKSGFIGVATFAAPEMISVKHGLAGAFKKSLTDPYDFIVQNLQGMRMLFTGKISARDNVSGPVQIAKLAGDTMRYRGVREYLLFMARISIILMIMNLLPIPAVDGSHIVFYLIEAVRGKPLPAGIMEKVQAFGFFLLIGLGVLVLFNDISKLVF